MRLLTHEPELPSEERALDDFIDQMDELVFEADDSPRRLAQVFEARVTLKRVRARGAVNELREFCRLHGVNWREA